VPVDHSRPYLKAAVERFKAFERVEQLHAYLAHRFAGPSELFSVPDCELDSVNRDAGLIGHLKFDR
jgi:hypothetical protein